MSVLQSRVAPVHDLELLLSGPFHELRTLLIILAVAAVAFAMGWLAARRAYARPAVRTLEPLFSRVVIPPGATPGAPEHTRTPTPTEDTPR
jgi:hypothetical protein